MSPQSPEDARRLVEDVIRCWRIEELAGFALARRGYGSGIGYGVIYPADLDPGDPPMPPDTVEIYGGYGEMFELVVPEVTYLAVLAEVLRRNGLTRDADAVADLSRRLAR
jgi:hypothetical protein